VFEMPETPFDIGETTPRWWVKIVGMLQHNWALPIPCDAGWTVIFVDDASGMFDRLEFANQAEMVEALERNGFEDFAATPRLQTFLHPPAISAAPA
jgi:hypothetical protein